MGQSFSVMQERLKDVVKKQDGVVANNLKNLKRGLAIFMLNGKIRWIKVRMVIKDKFNKLHLK